VGGSPEQPIDLPRPSVVARILGVWWVLLAAVPFGWLTFAAFLYAGIRARRRSWLWTGGVYFVLIWGATVVASVEELPEGLRQAGGFVFLFGWPVGFIHALALTPRYLRARAARRGTLAPAVSVAPPPIPPPVPPPPPSPPSAQPSSATPPVPREPLEVPGWKRGWAGGRVRFWLLVAFDVILILGGLLFLLSDQRVALVMLLFGVGTAFTLPLFVTWRRRGSVSIAAVPDRIGRTGLYFPYSRGKQRANVVGLIFMALACAAFTAFVPELEIRLAGLLGAAVFGLNALRLAARPGVAPYIALTEEGVAARSGATTWFIPWIAITNLGPLEIRMRSAREQFVGVAVSDRALVETGRSTRFFMRLNRWLAADISYSTTGLEVDPALLLASMLFYWRHPEARSELSTQAAVDRVTRVDLFGGSPPTGSGTT
jgi:hypothetical protein